MAGEMRTRVRSLRAAVLVFVCGALLVSLAEVSPAHAVDPPVSFSLIDVAPLTADAGYLTPVWGGVGVNIADPSTLCPDGCTSRFVFNPGPDQQVIPGGVDIPVGSTSLGAGPDGNVLVPGVAGEYDIVFEIYQLVDGNAGPLVFSSVVDPIMASVPVPTLKLVGAPPTLNMAAGYSLTVHGKTYKQGVAYPVAVVPEWIGASVPCIGVRRVGDGGPSEGRGSLRNSDIHLRGEGVREHPRRRRWNPQRHAGSDGSPANDHVEVHQHRGELSASEWRAHR